MLLGVSNNNIEEGAPLTLEKNHIFPGIIVLASVIYNAILAYINANITTVAVEFVIASEILIVLLATVYVLANVKLLPNMVPHILFFSAMALLAIVSMIANDHLYIKIIRDMYIVVLFVFLGTLMDKTILIRTFKFLTIITFIVILIEVFYSDLYISLFHPASYYLNTRGIPVLGESGFFRNTYTSESRFSFNFFAENRTSSIFLEQVSLANFSIILMIFITTFWKFLTKKEVGLFVSAILFFILTNDSRTGSALIVAILIGYFIFPKLPKNSHYLVFPVIISILIFFYDPTINSLQSDDLKGRFGLTAYKFSELDFKTAFLGQMDKIEITADSGYIYLIYGLTVWGLIIYWLYLSYILTADQKEMAKRLAFGASLFISVNLLTSWAVFTIKVAAPLWIMVGYVFNDSVLARSFERQKYFQRINSE